MHSGRHRDPGGRRAVGSPWQRSHVAHLTLLSLIDYIEGLRREARSRVRGRPEHDVENYGLSLLGEVSALQMHGPTCGEVRVASGGRAAFA